MSDEQEPQTCKELNKAMAMAAISLVGWIQDLDEDERTTPGAEGWSVKDHVAHLDVWLRGWWRCSGMRTGLPPWAWARRTSSPATSSA
ncbi:MAG: hypothetical protein R3A10_06915 [Caldilineaceae bacterium]